MTKRSIVPGEIEGFLSGCPFCTSYRIGIPEVGTRFRIISGFHADDTGTVVKLPEHYPLIKDEFIAQMDKDSPRYQTRVSVKGQMIQKIPFPPPPKWAPPLCLKDASELDKAILSFCHNSFRNNKWETDWNSFNEVIRIIWHYRLPIESAELWFVLRAHGVPSHAKKRIIEFYAQGSNLVTYCFNKKFRKKKRIEPLTK